jgi:hypothetical protein
MLKAITKVHLWFFVLRFSLIFSELTCFRVLEQIKLGRELLPE